MSEDMLRKPTPGRRLMHWFNNTSSLLDLHDDMFSSTLSKDFLQASDEELKQAYLQWNAKVISSVPKERLLVFKAQDGWKPLCDFLGLEEPVGLDYPHANRRMEMAQVLSAQIKRGHQLNCLILLLAGGMLLLSAVVFCLKRD
ncbi:unnamed protein product [Dibothriocephalus latus]|uniref:Sulfotransferase domain-containing protein n=1 Tax=Dibothriocephalus latus TaxID=60516 RepID=A0A3P7N357_DIBLA|nr:unnamed protein product [Dibothriocephalus latus]